MAGVFASAVFDEDVFESEPEEEPASTVTAPVRNRAGGSSTVPIQLGPVRPFHVPKVKGVSREPAIKAKVPQATQKLPPNEEELRRERWEFFRTNVRHMSYPEFICFEWLTKKEGMTEGIDFVYLFPVLGGRTRFGGFEVDFFFPSVRLAWLVQGLEFHFTDPNDRARDLLAKAILSARNVRVIALFEDDIIQRTQATLERAMRGEQITQRVD